MGLKRTKREADTAELANRRFTLMLVPEDGRGQVRQLTFRLAEVRRWFAIVAGLVVMAGVGVMMIATSFPRSLAYGDLIDENLALKARIREIEGTLNRLEDELRRLRLYDAQLRDANAKGIPGFGPLSDDELPWNALSRIDKQDSLLLLDERASDGDELIAMDGVSMKTIGTSYDETLGDPMEEMPGEVFARSQAGSAEDWAIAVHAHSQELLASLEVVELEMGQLVESAEYWRARQAAIPTDWPVDGRLTSGFGYRRSPFTRAWKFHKGIDISAPRGTPVSAPASGVVKMAQYNSGYGRMVILDHGFGIVSRYAHNSRLLVQEGEQVHRGQVIATVGSTGQSTGPHLHYEIFIEGRAVDPHEYLE